MYEDKKYEMKDPKESLHWINFSMKKSIEVQREIVVLLKDIKDRLSKLDLPTKTKSDEIPF